MFVVSRLLTPPMGPPNAIPIPHPRRAHSDARHFLPVGRSFFSKTDAGAEVPIGGGAVAFLGHFAIVHSTQVRF